MPLSGMPSTVPDSMPNSVSAPVSLAVVLVRPEIPENIGLVARTLQCYNIGELRIAGTLPDLRQARKTGVNAHDILDKMIFSVTLEEALAPFHFALGFTRRPRDPGQRILDLRDIVSTPPWTENPGPTRIALVFGCESQGLSREETLRMTHLVKIPLPNQTMSLNLSHAIGIALHEFHQPSGMLVRSSGLPESGNLTVADRDASYRRVLEWLEERGYFKLGKSEAARDRIRILWQRLDPDKKEMEFLLGLLRKGTEV